MVAKPHWQMQEVACNLCGSRDAAPLFAQDQHGCGLHTVMCRECGLIYLNPRPSERDYAEFYRTWYHRWYPSRAAFHASALGHQIALLAAEKRCRAYTRFLRNDLRLLEVGPGDGAFLTALRRFYPGSELHGVDLSPTEVHACQEKHLDVLRGTLAGLPGRYCGNTHIVLFHVLEHALDPVSLLREAAARLRPDGTLFVEVPNILGSWQGLGMLHVAHPYQFAPATLQGTLRAAGFEVVQLEALEEPLFPSSLRAVARLSEPSAFHPLPAMPSVEEMQALFAEKLAGWRGQLLWSSARRSVCRMAGQKSAAHLWERTAGRRWKQALDAQHQP